MSKKLTAVCCFTLLTACSTANYSPAPVTSVWGYKSELKNTSNGATYRVSKGETLYAIAWQTNQDYQYLAALNQIQDPYNIYPGQILKIRGSVPLAERYPAKTSSHTLRPLAPVVKPKAVTPPVKSTPSNAKTHVASKPQVVVKTKPVTQPKLVNKPQVANHGKLSWKWPASGQLLSNRGAGQVGQSGINIAGQLGQLVTAAESGRVVYAGNGLRGYGNLLIIKHNDDYLSAYAFNQKLLVKEQQWVTSGQAIASMGNAGPSPGAALYFEIRYRGQPVSPMRYLSKR